MKMFLVSLVLALAVTAASARTSKTKVELAFEKHGLTKYIKVPPKVYVTAEYSGHIFVELGNELTPAQVPKPPQKSFAAEEKAYYTIIFVDVNCSKNPKIQCLHGLIMNIPGGRVKDGALVADYIPPQPPQYTGYHYYISLVYKQAGVIDVEQVKTDYPGVESPETFCLKEFTELYCLGDPYGGNFFKAQYQYPADAKLH